MVAKFSLIFFLFPDRQICIKKGHEEEIFVLVVSLKILETLTITKTFFLLTFKERLTFYICQHCQMRKCDCVLDDQKYSHRVGLHFVLD